MATIAITPTQDAVTTEIFIAAPPERVFQAITDPAQAPKWWGTPGMYRTTKYQADLRPGGKWSNAGVGADGSEYHVDGEYLEVDPPRLLVHTWKASWSGDLKTTVRWELEPRDVHGLRPKGPQKEGKGTLVRVHHSGFAGHPQACQSHGDGWTRVFGWLQAYLERGETYEMRKLAAVVSDK